MNLRFIIPVIQPPAAIPATHTWDSTDVVIIDNTTLGLWRDICAERGWQHLTMLRNLGVATSWNLGARWAFEYGCDTVSFISSSVYWRDGLAGWRTLIEQHANDVGLLTEETFHVTAWSRSTFARIGWFDENFYPAYNEDIDWLRRLEVSGLHVPAERAESVGHAANPMPKVAVNVNCDNAVTLKAGAVTVDFARSERYYISKWLGPKHEEKTDRPFGLHVPISWWPVLRDV